MFTDSVIGFAKAKFKGFCIYSEAVACMASSCYLAFNVFDGKSTYSKSIYEQGRGQHINAMEYKLTKKDGTSKNEGGTT